MIIIYGQRKKHIYCLMNNRYGTGRYTARYSGLSFETGTDISFNQSTMLLTVLLSNLNTASMFPCFRRVDRWLKPTSRSLLYRAAYIRIMYGFIYKVLFRLVQIHHKQVFYYFPFQTLGDKQHFQHYQVRIDNHLHHDTRYIFQAIHF